MARVVAPTVAAAHAVAVWKAKHVALARAQYATGIVLAASVATIDAVEAAGSAPEAKPAIVRVSARPVRLTVLERRVVRMAAVEPAEVVAKQKAAALREHAWPVSPRATGAYVATMDAEGVAVSATRHRSVIETDSVSATRLDALLKNAARTV